MRKPYVNPQIKANCRADRVYATIMADLVDAGVIAKDVAEKIAGYPLLTKEVNAPAKPTKRTNKKEEEEDEE